MSQSSLIAAFQCEPVSAEGTQEGKEYLSSSSHQTAATPYGEPQETSGCEKHRILAPIADMHMEGMISVSSDSCIFPYKESAKFLNEISSFL